MEEEEIELGKEEEEEEGRQAGTAEHAGARETGNAEEGDEEEGDESKASEFSPFLKHGV